MEDVVHPLHRVLRDAEVGEIAFEEIGAVELREILAIAGNQTVRTRTCSPRRISSSARWDPMKPAPPVTRYEDM